MKKLLLLSVALLAWSSAPYVHAQSVVRETTTTTTAPVEVTGTVSEFAPGNVIIRQKDVTAPVNFSFAKKVEYVDAAGNTVTREVITPGTPVTVRYIREGDRMLVDRVIVQRTAAPITATTSETTTTTHTVTGREGQEMDKLRGKIAHEERELADHPDKVKLQEELARDRAALEAIQNTR